MLRGLVWVTGRAWSNGREVTSWEILAISSSPGVAKDRCESPSDFVGEHYLDEELPDNTCAWPGAEYPLDGLGLRP